MSVVPMKLLTVAGPLGQIDAVVRACVINQAFHPESAMQAMRGVKGLRPFQTANPHTALLRRAEDVAGALGVSLRFAQFEESADTGRLSAYFDELERELGELTRRRDAMLHLAEEKQGIASQLVNLHGVSAHLDELWDLRYARFRYGYLPRETYESFQEALEDDADLLFFPTNVGPRQVFGVYFTTKNAHKRVDILFNSLHFTRIHIDARPHGTVDEAIAELGKQAAEAAAQAQAAADAVQELKRREENGLLEAYSHLRYDSDVFDVRRYAAHTRETFYLVGWVPLDGLDRMMERLEAFGELSCVVDSPEDAEGIHPPTKLKNALPGRIFRPFLEMYGLPAYNELDPSTFMAVTYCLFFGIMFGDIGQGLCLALAGVALSRWKKLWLGNIITCCGLSGALFGCLYGSVFGNEELLGGFKVLEGNNVMTLLALSLALGAVMITVVMGLNIANGLRQKNYEKAFFGSSGLAGLVFYVGVLALAVCALSGAADLLTPAYLLPVLALPLLLMLFKEPLGKLLSGDPDWRRVRWGQLIGVGVFELFETLLSYLTNSLSFLRVGAYAITHVGLMLVVRMLAGAGNPVVLVLGNLFVIGFEGLLVGIQVLRLEFYELFGRFYSDGGTPFAPRTIDYTTREHS